MNAALTRVFAHPPLAPAAKRVLWAMLVLGVVARVFVAFKTRGQGFDITSFELARDVLRSDPLNLYGLLNEANAPHWPYPPGFLVWVAVAGGLTDFTGWRFDGFIQLAPIMADAALAWIVQAFLGQQGASERLRLAAAGLIALGPSFAVVSGYHGQIDSVCILPAVLAFWIWTRSTAFGHRAVTAGLLIGLGVSVKVTAGLVLLALLPSAGSPRESARLTAAAAVIPALLLAPFLAADFAATIDGLTANRGLPGFGGISLLAQPDLSAAWLHTKEVALSPVSDFLFDHGSLFALAALAGATVFLYRRSASAKAAVVVIWLSFYVFGINFSLTYLVLGIPFFLLLGRVREVALLQAAVLVPTLLLYVNEGRSLPLEVIYTPIMLAVWAGLLLWWLKEIRHVRADLT